ncbi:endonuclease MutS2 [Caloramator proteoclasticus]|uniref:Endonuclease MutS2 n=1 Tax=Caloramator proteoclasticus DSM 10124 TaxID=1121262 RepID=A0A1M4XE33_9CLOT|nr:endonuclease MutS2 [Caloramator proteoclasticus]SHE91725.1 DNA mismatch repair protein MutS2 [Caloramator proteoclasticus DSM 10124]
MNEKTLRILEYNKIIDMLQMRATTEIAKKMIRELKPSSNIHEVRERLEETREGFEVVLKWGSLPISVTYDLQDTLKRAKMGYTLQPIELLRVNALLRCTRQLKEFMKDGNKQEICPIIYEIIDSLATIKGLENEIETKIISESEISDRASEKLYSIRRAIRDKNAKVKEKLQSMLQSYSKYLQDPIITLRGDRYVLPVKAEFKGNVPGLVHDQSASGSTLFIEPMAVVELNNEIKELMLKEKQEIERILYELSVKVADNADMLEHNNLNIGYIDFILAKGRFGLDLDASIPEINQRGLINLKRARHPLIDKEVVVPIDVKLGDTYKALVITGPNTGGKTVTLKTTGLLTLMAMTGLAIPASSGSQVSVFNKVFADIGDEQSIEQSLSTFSSHMTNIVNILKEVDETSLILVDELGAGTDPTEGAALAMSILEYIFEKGAKIVATTHYSELKVFAMEKEGFENASVEFDVETLRPTYRLLIGIPGKSNAFEISKRLGLSNEIIENAKLKISKDAARFEDVIQALQNKTIQLEKEYEEIEAIKRESLEIKRQLSEKKFKLDSQRENIIKKAQDEARRILQQAKYEADSIVKELVELKKNSEAVSLKQAEEARRKLKENIDELNKKSIEKKEEEFEALEDVNVGDEVFVTTVSQKGVVLSKPDSKGEVQVQIGIIKMNVPLNKLKRVEQEKKEVKKSGIANIIKQKAQNISTEIDLRGQTVDEALYNLDKYLDDAYLAGLNLVRIIHGKGTGALREGIKQALRKHHYVKSMRSGDISEGGSGVTIVELK